MGTDRSPSVSTGSEAEPGRLSRELMVLLPCLLEAMETRRHRPWPSGTETYLVSTGMVLAPLVHEDWWWGELLSAVREVIG